jgi:hypothetical protein
MDSSDDEKPAAKHILTVGDIICYKATDEIDGKPVYTFTRVDHIIQASVFEDSSSSHMFLRNDNIIENDTLVSSMNMLRHRHSPQSFRLQVKQIKRFHEGSLLDHNGSFRPLSSYRAIEEAIRNAKTDMKGKLEKQLFLETSEDDKSVKVASVVASASAVNTKMVDKTPKTKNKGGSRSTQKHKKKKRSAHEDSDDDVQFVAHVTAAAMEKKTQELTRHNEKMEGIEERKLSKSVEQADWLFTHTKALDDQKAEAEAKHNDIELKSKLLEYNQKLYVTYESMKAKGMSKAKIVKFFPDMKTFVDDGDDDDETKLSLDSQKRARKKK